MFYKVQFYDGYFLEKELDEGCEISFDSLIEKHGDIIYLVLVND